MLYPYSQNIPSTSGSLSTFRGINRTERGRSGEWSEAFDLDTEHYPCLAPRKKHGSIISINSDGTAVIDGSVPATAKIAACGEIIKDDGEYHGFTGVALYDFCALNDTETEKNFCFIYNGKVQNVGTINADPGSRTALWQYAAYDQITDEELSSFKNDIERVIWSVVCVGTRYVINGYDPVLKRGKLFSFDPEDEDTQAVIDAAGQREFSGGISMGSTSSVSHGYNEYSHVNYISSSSSSNYSCKDFSEYFSEGDYLLIEVTEGYADDYVLKKHSTFPYSRSGSYTKYAVVREIVNKYDDNVLESSTIYYYSTRADGKFNTNSRISSVKVRLGTFTPPMQHIAAFGSRIWGVNPDEDSVYASVFDTPFKMINSDTQLDKAMSWQIVLGTPDRVTGVFPAGSELIVFKRNSLIRINGTSAFSFGITGMFRNCGCIDIHSAAECAGCVFYLGYGGFYAYDGSQPRIISSDLGRSYTAAFGFCDEDKYYACAVTDTNETEFLVYDIKNRIWHQWQGTSNLCGIFRVGADIYMAFNDNGGKVRKLCGGRDLSAWSCESVIHYESANDFKGINELWIRAKIEEGNKIDVYTSVNNSEWKPHKQLVPKGRIFVYKIPVRFLSGDFWKYKLVGTGGAIIYGIERIMDFEGRRHYAH